MIDQFYEAFTTLAAHPGIGQSRDNLASGVPCFPSGRYVIYFSRLADSQDTIEIVRVIHGSRDVDSRSFG